MTQKKQPKSQEPIEDFILRHFEENFLRLKFESGHGLAPEVKEAAKRQVLLYWRRLRDVAVTITDTEVRLNLPGQKTPKKRKFCIEGVVDIVREKGRTVMYDLKTHDPDHVRQNLPEYERQLNVYAFIWKNLRQQDLNETAILATQFPDSLNAAWEYRDENSAAFEQQLQQWDPIIPIPLDPQHVQETIQGFACAVDDIEDGKYSPPQTSRLKQIEVRNQIFATRVCRNCDVRFSCNTYREYVQTSRSRDLPRFSEIYEDTGTDEDHQSRIEAGLETVPVEPI